MKLIADKKLYCGHVRKIILVHPSVGYPEYSLEDNKAVNNQKFAWHPDGVLFDCEDGCVWLTAYEAEEIQVKPETETAILVEMTVPEEGCLHTFSEEQMEPYKLALKPGRYKLLFELRNLLPEEYSVDKYAKAYDLLELNLHFIPELCTLTFVATEEEVEPQLLRFAPIIPIKSRKQVRQGLMSVEDFMPKTLILSDEKLE